MLSHSLAICSSTPCIHRSRFPIYTALPTVMRVGNHIERLTTELHSDPTSTFPICCMFAARFSTTSSQSQEDGCGCTSATTMAQVMSPRGKLLIFADHGRHVRQCALDRSRRWLNQSERQQYSKRLQHRGLVLGREQLCALT